MMVDNKAYIPGSCKMGMILIAPPEAKKSENYITLCTQKDAYVIKTQTGLASYTISTHDLNCKDVHKNSSFLLHITLK